MAAESSGEMMIVHICFWITVLVNVGYRIFINYVLVQDDAQYTPSWVQLHFLRRRGEEPIYRHVLSCQIQNHVSSPSGVDTN